MSMLCLLTGSIISLVLSAYSEEGIFGATVVTDSEHRRVPGERVRGELLVTRGTVLFGARNDRNAMLFRCSVARSRQKP